MKTLKRVDEWLMRQSVERSERLKSGMVFASAGRSSLVIGAVGCGVLSMFVGISISKG